MTGLEAFEKITRENFDSSISLVRNWLSDGSASVQCTLKKISKEMSDELREKILGTLSFQEREKWKNYILKDFTAKELAEIDPFLLEEVKKEFISPSSGNYQPIIDLVLQMTTDQLKNFIETSQYGHILMCFVPGKKLAQILDEVEISKAAKLMQASTQFNPIVHSDDFGKFKTDLDEYFNKYVGKPFSAKLMQIVGDFKPSREGMIYRILAKQGMREETLKLAQLYFPVDLLRRLPKEVLRNIFQNYNPQKRVEFLMSCEEEDRRFYLLSFAEEGSTVREMLDMEFKSIEESPDNLKRVKNSHENYLTEFVNYVRLELKKDPQLLDQCRILVQEWSKELFSDNVTNLKSKT